MYSIIYLFILLFIYLAQNKIKNPTQIHEQKEYFCY